MKPPRALVLRTRARPIACTLPGLVGRSVNRGGEPFATGGRRIGLGQHGRLAAEEAVMTTPRKGKARETRSRHATLSQAEIDSIVEIVLASDPDSPVLSKDAYPQLFRDNPEALRVYLTTHALIFGIPEQPHGSGPQRKARRATSKKSNAKKIRKTNSAAVPRKTGSR
jgi:hypothetical protein